MKSITIPARPAGWLASKKLSRVMLLLAASLLLLLLVGLLSFLFVQDLLAFGKFPNGVSVLGVNVAGLTKTEAVRKCKSELKDVADRPLAVVVDDERYEVTPQDIGLKLEYQKMVDDAYREAWSVNLAERMARRFMNKPKEINVSLKTVSDPEMVQSWLEQVINAINRHPQDAYVDVTSGRPVIVPAKDGRNANMDELIADTEAALRRPDRTVKARYGTVPAQFTDAVFSKLMVINLAEHKISVYNREQLLAEYPVAVGSSAYPTPVGIWKVVSKTRNPAWINPGSGWAAGMPPYIPPGPGNPLGTRAIALNASGVNIHGTPSPWSIGHSVSHGCVRMYMRDVEQLFELVDVNMPVYTIHSAGNPGFDVTRRPYWWK